MVDSDTPDSGSPLSDIDSIDVPDVYARMNRSHSPSDGSDMSDPPSDGSMSPSTSTPRHSDVPPAKRRRTGATTYDHLTPQSSLQPPRSPTGSISSDTSGSVPTSPRFAQLGPTHPLSTAYAAAQANPSDPEMADYIQVTRCQWTGCTDPEQGNMDRLVDHINNIHIPPRQKKYYCEWEGCTRKSLPHTSAYALKAHMRSHTKEKPFMCALPECDRSFTRSDALAKHMRTVHETEALRPSDPIPRGHTGGISTGAHGMNGTIKRIKLVMGGANGEKRSSIISELPPLPTRQILAAERRVHPDTILPSELPPLTSSESTDPDLKDAVSIDSTTFTLPIPADYYPSDIYDTMEDYEKSLPPSQYFRLLRRQIHWATQETNQLNKEIIETRATTDDDRGREYRRTTSTSAIAAANHNTNPATKDPAAIGTQVYSSLDERIGDEVRREEWFVAEALLDKILQTDVDIAVRNGRLVPAAAAAITTSVESSGGGGGGGTASAAAAAAAVAGDITTTTTKPDKSEKPAKDEPTDDLTSLLLGESRATAAADDGGSGNLSALTTTTTTMTTLEESGPWAVLRRSSMETS